MTPNTIIQGDCVEKMKEFPADSIDLIATDPPYGIGFMGKEWDTFKPDVIQKGKVGSMRKDRALAKKAETARNRERGRIDTGGAMEAARYDHTPRGGAKFREWFTGVSREMLRVLKPGAFAFVCIGARQDSVAAAITAMTEAGFKTDFTSIFWTYASGFPKAANLQKKGGPAGAYGGFQPKPAVEVIVVAMKPMSEKTFLAQVKKNGKGTTWLDDCRIPTDDKLENQGRSPEASVSKGIYGNSRAQETHQTEGQKKGRFPANLLISDDVLNDNQTRKAGKNKEQKGTGGIWQKGTNLPIGPEYGDSGSYSRYFSLDAWWASTFPFLIVPKVAKSEKNKGLSGFEGKTVSDGPAVAADNAFHFQRGKSVRKNTHPTVKPLQLMSYLIALGSRPGDVVLDPFLGSGTTALAAKQLGRKYIGIEKETDYINIAEKRINNIPNSLFL